MGQITGVTATPSTVSPGGASVIRPTVIADSGSQKMARVTVSLDGASGSADVILATPAEVLTYSLNAADKGKPGYVVFETDTGTLTLNPDGTATLHL